jgi:hypothetical protein
VLIRESCQEIEQSNRVSNTFLMSFSKTGVYANHNVRLEKIHIYGFDYDYTLAHYTPALQYIIYELARNHLVQEVSSPRNL